MPQRSRRVIWECCTSVRAGNCENTNVSLTSRKKNGRATSGDRGGEPTDQVARPLLGDRRWVSGEEIVSATITEAKLVPRKNRAKCWRRRRVFFSFCDEVQSEVSIWAIFRRDRPVLQVATCLPDATTEMLIDAPVQPADCRELTAVGHLASCAGAGDVLMARSRQLM